MLPILQTSRQGETETRRHRLATEPPRLLVSLAPGLPLRLCAIAIVLSAVAWPASAQDLNAVRDDQINRLRNYVVDAILPSGLVRDSLVLEPGASHFHPATPDAAGFALIENGLLKGPWVMGESYTIADPYLFTLAQWLEADGVDTSRLPRVMAQIHERLCAA